MSPTPFVDTFGRQVRKLRLSVTDRCNFRCRYCLPEEPTWMPRSDLLTFEEIERLVRVLAPHGVNRLRLTGGEPLVRSDLERLVERLRAVPEVESIAMTTNGYFLRQKAKLLREAGLDSVTVSLDALDREAFDEMVKRPAWERVMDGIDVAREVGFRPIKINCVVLKDSSEEQLVRFAEMSRGGDFVVRFIEYMPLDSGGAWDMSQVLTGAEIREQIGARFPIEPVAASAGHEASNNDPARMWRFTDGAGQIGFISSVSEPFCGSCDRIRMTADGHILNCLFGTVEYDLRELLRGGASDADIVELIRSAIQAKAAGHLINRPGFVKPKRSMASIGG